MGRSTFPFTRRLMFQQLEDRRLLAGDLDLSFGGGDGIATLDLGGSDFIFNQSLVAQDDGKLVVVGQRGLGNFEVARLNADGSPDATFNADGNTDGIISVDAGGFDIARSVAVQPDGKILVAGGSGGLNATIVRLDINGALDNSFGSGGISTIFAPTGGSSVFTEILVQPDGKVVGSINGSHPTSFFAARLNSDGTPDAGFGVAGLATIDLSGSSTDGKTEFSDSVAMQPDGRLVLGGSVRQGAATDFAVARLDTNGSLDGIAITSIGGNDVGIDIVVQSSGRIVLGGLNNVGSHLEAALVGYQPDLGIDLSFGTNGVAQPNFGFNTPVYGLAVDAVDRLIAVMPFNGDFELARFTSAGTLDPTFNGGNAPLGQVSTDLGANDNAFSVAVQSDGKIVAAGQNGSDSAVVRYLGDTAVPNQEPSFSASNVAIDEDAAAVALFGWASFDPGAATEATQSVLAYAVTNISDTSLFSATPTVDPAGTLTFTPAPNAFGSATIEVVVQDDGGVENGGDDTSQPQTFTIDILPVNDAPSFAASDPPPAVEDGGPQSISAWATFTAGPTNEASQSVLAYNVTVLSNPALFQTPPAVDAAGNLTYTPALNANGTANISVTVQDDGGTENGGNDTSAAQVFTITVLSAEQQIDNIAASLQTRLADTGLLNQRTVDLLVKRLGNAERALTRGATRTATRHMQKLHKRLTAYVSKGIIELADVEPILEAIDKAIVSIREK